MRYDPYAPRCFEGIKLNLLEGRPTVVRVHSAANYPSGENGYLIDQEGHAILIIGYNDDIHSFAVVDPFRRENQLASITWLRYEQLAITMVDMSLGNDLESPCLDVEANILDDEVTLEVTCGIPIVYGTIMDQEQLFLRRLEINISLHNCKNTENFHHIAKTEIPIGTKEIFQIKIPKIINKNFQASIFANGYIKCNRPYEYEYRVGADLDFHLEK